MNPEIFGELQGSEMVISRLVAAPQELVFRALTSPNHLANWWGPEGFSITTLAWDFREGGHWRSIMHGPDGTDYPNRLIYKKITPPHLLEYLHDDDGHSSQQFQGSLELKPEGDATRITLRARFASEAEAREMMERANAIEGGKHTLGRLAAFLEEVPGEFDFLLQREFPVSVETLFAAWTEPEHLLKWWGPQGFTTSNWQVNAQAGGEVSFVVHSPEGEAYPVKGNFHLVEKPTRLVYSLQSLTPQGAAGLDTKMELQLTPKGDGTHLRLKICVLNFSATGKTYLAGLEPGWDQGLEKLKRVYPKITQTFFPIGTNR